LSGYLQHNFAANTSDSQPNSDAVIIEGEHTMQHLGRKLSMSAIGAALIFFVGACNNQTGFSGSVGNTPNGPKLPTLQILGTAGTPFTATVSDSRSYWTFSGNVPLSVVVCNNPSDEAQLVATKLVADNSLLSVQIISGFHIVDLQSTSAPDGTVQVQVGTLTGAGPSAAVPNLQIFLSGPANVRYQALVEDLTTGFIINERAPTLILFDTPDGKVDATFFGPNNHTTFTADMTIDGIVVVPTFSEGPNLTIREP
jgi:hypothetical protein